MQQKKKETPIPKLPEGFILKDGIATGIRAPGVLEIVYFNPKRKNASNGHAHLVVANAVNGA